MAALQSQYDPVLAEVLSRNNTLVFIDVVIQQEPIGRIKLELFSSLFPITSSNFLALITGSYRPPPSNLPVGYKSVPLHRVIRGTSATFGDITKGDGSGQLNIFTGSGTTFPPELLCNLLDVSGSAVAEYGRLPGAPTGPTRLGDYSESSASYAPPPCPEPVARVLGDPSLGKHAKMRALLERHLPLGLHAHSIERWRQARHPFYTADATAEGEAPLPTHLRHSTPGLLCMVSSLLPPTYSSSSSSSSSSTRPFCGSQFALTLGPLQSLDEGPGVGGATESFVFGRVADAESMTKLRMIEALSINYVGKPKMDVSIGDCGEL